MKQFLHRVFIIGAWVTIVSAIALMILVAHWLLKDYNVIEAKQPIIVMNENKEIAIGKPMVLKVEYTKNMPLEAQVFPTIQCKSGNLVTLTPYQSNIPVGTNTVIFDEYLLPPKVSVGDTCQVVLSQSYQVNPLKVEAYAFYSEFFVVLSKVD